MAWSGATRPPASVVIAAAAAAVVATTVVAAAVVAAAVVVAVVAASAVSVSAEACICHTRKFIAAEAFSTLIAAEALSGLAINVNQTFGAVLLEHRHQIVGSDELCVVQSGALKDVALFVLALVVEVDILATAENKNRSLAETPGGTYVENLGGPPKASGRKSKPKF